MRYLNANKIKTGKKADNISHHQKILKSIPGYGVGLKSEIMRPGFN